MHNHLTHTLEVLEGNRFRLHRAQKEAYYVTLAIFKCTYTLLQKKLNFNLFILPGAPGPLNLT